MSYAVDGIKLSSGFPASLMMKLRRMPVITEATLHGLPICREDFGSGFASTQCITFRYKRNASYSAKYVDNLGFTSVPSHISSEQLMEAIGNVGPRITSYSPLRGLPQLPPSLVESVRTLIRE